MRIALNGASGYTGRLAAAELARRGIDAASSAVTRLAWRRPRPAPASRSGSRTSATRTRWRVPSPGPMR